MARKKKLDVDDDVAVEEVSISEKPKKSKGKSAKEIVDESIKKAKAYCPADDIDELLDSVEKKYGLSSSLVDRDEQRLSTGLLSLDLLLNGGIVGGGWYTIYGGEQSCKSTLTMTLLCMIQNAIDERERKIAAGIFDYEGSSDVEYISNMMEALGLKANAAEIFGIKDDETGEWLVKPKIRYYMPDNGEEFFKYLAKVKRALPDVQKIGDNYWYVYEHTQENKKKFSGMYDTKYLTKTNKIRIPAPDGFMQAVYICDSYPAMLPDGLDDDDRNDAMAEQARMFSTGIKKIRAGMRKKRMTVFGVNQLRLRPAVMHGNPEYEPCGEALKFFCMTGDTFIQSEKGMLTALEYYQEYSQTKKLPKLLGYQGMERPTIFDTTGRSSILELKTEYGFSVAGKPSHRTMMIKSGGWKYDWTKLSQVVGSTDYYVPVKVGSDVWSKDPATFDYEHYSRHSNEQQVVNIPNVLTQDLAFVLGALSGDGHVTGENGLIQFISGDEDFFAEYCERIRDVFGVEPTVKTVGNAQEARIYSTEVAGFLSYLGATGYSRTKTVPRCIRTSPKKFFVEFLRGYLNADGNVSKKEVSVNSNSKDLLNVLQQLCLNAGIITKLSMRETKYHKESKLNEVHRLSFVSYSVLELHLLLSEFGGLCKRKQKQLDATSTKENSGNQLYNLDVIPFDLLSYECVRGDFKLKEHIESAKGKRKFYRLSDFDDSWFKEAKEVVSNCRTSQERAKNARILSELTEFLDYTVRNNLLWTKVVGVDRNRVEEMTYDANMPDTHTITTNGIVSHNSDVRIKATSRGSAPYGFVLDKGIMEESSVNVEGGKDIYRFIVLRTTKNKLGGIPNREVWARVWVSDGNGQARGFDPVFDTFEYLKQLGYIDGTRNNLKFHPDVPLHGAKKLSFEDFKVLVLGTKKEITEVCERVGLKKAGNIRAWCAKHCASGKGPKRYKDQIVKRSKDKIVDGDE